MSSRHGERLQVTGRRELLGLDAERGVGAGVEVRQPDERGELDQRGRAELVEQPGRQLVGHRGRGLRHRLGVLHDVALQRREDVGLAPPGHLTRLGHVEPLVVGLEVAEVQAEAASDEAGHRHVGKRLQVLVTLVPLLCLATDAEAEVQHLTVVPRHLDRLGHAAEHLAGHPLDHRAVDAGQFSLRDPGVAGHVSSRVSLAFNMETPAGNRL
jgi:hypothetical protein